MALAANQRVSVVAASFRLLLMLTLWQGPIPWGHQHSGSSPELAAHLAQCHTGEESAKDLGWHWHFILPHRTPSQSSGDSSSEPPLLPDYVVLPVIVSVSGTSNWTADTNQTPFALDLIQEEWSCRPQIHSAAFLTTYDPTHSPQQLLCRLNC